MPLDPSIPLSFQAPRVSSPMQSFGQAMQLRLAQDNADALQEQRRAMAEDRQAQTDGRRRAQADEESLGEAFKVGGGVRDTTINWARTNNPRLLPTLTEYFDKADERTATILKRRHELQGLEADLFGDLADGALSHGGTPEAIQTALAYTVEKFPEYEGRAKEIWGQVQGADDAGRKKLLEGIRDQSPAYRARGAKNTPQVVPPGGVLVDDKGKVLHTTPAKPPEAPNVGSFEDYLVRFAAEKGLDPKALTTAHVEQARKAYGQADDRQPITVNLGAPGGNADDIAQGIMRGEQSPDTRGLYKDGPAVRGILARAGYNHAAALSDWNATQRHFSTLNGPQQTRIRQAVDTAYHSLDLIDELSSQWKGGKFPILNKANLALARNGVYGEQAQSIATQLEGQITDLTSELGNVFMGGNSPTDHALKLAGKNLSADWSEKVLKDMTALARKNLLMRQNSMKNVGVIGASPDSPYAPRESPQPSPAPTGGTVLMVTPDGRRLSIPADKVAEAEQRGAKRVQ